MYTYNGSNYLTRHSALVAACGMWLGSGAWLEATDTADSLAGALIADRWTAGAITDETGAVIAYSRNEYTDAMRESLHVLGGSK